MSTTFVLGAGFSADAGMPLARHLRERVQSFIQFDRHSSYSPLLEASWEYPKGQFCTGLEQIDSTGKLQFEELFAELRRQHVTSVSEGPAYTAEWVLRIGCARLLWCIHGLNPFPGWCYRNLASWLAHEARSCRSRSRVVSFNWDVVVETALTEAGISWSYSLSEPATVPILKPHGSINWNRDLSENPRKDYGPWRPIRSDSRFWYPEKTPLNNPDQDVFDHDRMYMLFPYDTDPRERDEEVRRIWGDVETALADSQKVVFIGYSFPEYDSWASSFFRDHTSGEVEVYNPCPQDLQKYRNLFGSRIVREGGHFSSCPYAQG